MLPSCWWLQRGSAQVKRSVATFDVTLTTYELAMAEADTERLASIPWEYVVTDEAHRLKSLKSKLRSQLLRLRFSHLLLLTGGPPALPCLCCAFIRHATQGPDLSIALPGESCLLLVGWSTHLRPGMQREPSHAPGAKHALCSQAHRCRTTWASCSAC